MSSIQKITLLLCDDNPDFLSTLKTLVTLQGNIQVLGEARNGSEGFSKIQELKPEVVILDLGMPVMDGPSLIKKIRSSGLNTKIIVLSQNENPDWLDQLIQNDIDGFVLKSDSKDNILSAIITVATGEKYFSPTVASLFYKKLTRQGGIQKSYDPAVELLTPKEKEVAKNTSKGFSVKEIADAMGLSENTIKTHKSNLMKKINAKNSAEVTLWVLKNL
ncbi:MAG: response regulator transcription factor [Proteobacteria bacterium]|jgi:DNA-binding NarL/FixJ family response regulator|nr:response regulator transcription factor [Pseudomonadota bacterium]